MDVALVGSCGPFKSPHDQCDDFRVGKKFGFIFWGQNILRIHVIKPG